MNGWWRASGSRWLFPRCRDEWPRNATYPALPRSNTKLLIIFFPGRNHIYRSCQRCVACHSCCVSTRRLILHKRSRRAQQKTLCRVESSAGSMCISFWHGNKEINCGVITRWKKFSWRSLKIEHCNYEIDTKLFLKIISFIFWKGFKKEIKLCSLSILSFC